MGREQEGRMAFDSNTGKIIWDRDFNRRDFLGLSARAGAAIVVGEVLAACGGSESAPRQQDFVVRLKNQLKQKGYNENANEEELRDFIAKKTFDDKSWMTDTSIGSINTSTGAHNLFIKENGEINPGNIPVKFKYPMPDLSNLQEPEVFEVENVKIVVYGTLATKGKIKNGLKSMGPFIKDYFKPTEGIHSYLHLNFLPPDADFHYKFLPSDSTDPYRSKAAATGTKYDDKQNNKITEQHVVMNFNLMHTRADFYGLTPLEFTTVAFANENVNLHARRQRGKVSINEAPSTVFGWLSAFDPKTATKLMGLFYEPAMKLFDKEMNDLEEIGKRQSYEGEQTVPSQISSSSNPFTDNGAEMISSSPISYSWSSMGGNFKV
ncbi:hypothetical protein HYW54_03950 [Candidatus Gottesmanbacteria bacterium]|nr:hypothetical protein [Candidatus Gottesmanbacteria bacterium]